MRVLFAALLLAGSSLHIPALAHDYSLGDLHIQHPWSRPLPPVAPTGAVYLDIENRGEHGDRLTGASTPIAGYVELHEHVHENGLMKMRQIDGLELAPGQSVEFTPGGYHVMLFDLKQPLTAGHEYPLTLIFQQAGEVEVMVKVQQDTTPKASAEGHHHHP